MRNEQLPLLGNSGSGAPPASRRLKYAVAAVFAFAAAAGTVAYYKGEGTASSPPSNRQLVAEEDIPRGPPAGGNKNNDRNDQTDYDHTIDEPPVHPPPSGFGQAVIEAVPSLNPEDIPGPPPMEDGGSLIAAQFGPDPFADQDKMQMILDGELTLVDIRYLPGSFSSTLEGDGYENVWCDFCKMEWELNKEDPSKYPSVRDIMGESRHCSEHRYSLPCTDVITAVRAHDASPAESNGVHPVDVTGILLHEGRSGCTVVSNALTVAEPDTTKVIAEHPAPTAVVMACDKIRNKHLSEDCDEAKQVALLRDVVMLLSRTSDADLTNLYVKMHASGSAYVDIIRKAFPESKWGFCFRDADVALTKATQKKRNSCLKMQRSPSSALLQYANEKSVDLKDVSGVEVCSMHLGSLVKSAFDEHQRSSTGLLIDYDEQLKSGTALVDTILPYFGMNTKEDGEARDRVMDVTKRNANARKSGKMWTAEEEEQDKQGVVDEVKDASERYVKVDTMNIYRSRG